MKAIKEIKPVIVTPKCYPNTWEMNGGVPGQPVPHSHQPTTRSEQSGPSQKVKSALTPAVTPSAPIPRTRKQLLDTGR